MTTKQEELSVAAIKEGSVIDHIPVGQGVKIMKLLQLAAHHTKVTVGLHLPSRSMGYKDLIKVEDLSISSELAGQIAIFAPQATLVHIRNFEVVRKEKVHLPARITQVIRCSNSRCVTNHEPVMTEFFVIRRGRQIQLRCKYCEKKVPYEAY